MALVDLAADDLDWIEAPIAGAPGRVRMSFLHRDEERGVRSVLVAFPDGWRRDATGTQPAGEELVVLRGGLTLSGLTAAPGRYLHVTPRALRHATSTQDGTRAVVWFTGEGGGWVEGDELVSGTATLGDLDDGFVREETDGLHGRVELRQDAAGTTFDADVEVLWAEGERYAHVPRGEVVPDVPGRALVRFLG